MDRFGEQHQPALMSYGFFVVSIFHNVANQLMQLQCELHQSAHFLPEKRFQELTLQLEHINKVIRHSQEILKQEQSEPRLFAIAPVLQQTKRLCQLTLQREQIRCDISCPKHLQIQGDPIVFQQIILNLLFNSVTSLKKVEIARRWIFIKVHTNRSKIKIAITDCGLGFPSNHINQFKEPFTTQQTDHVGLGLAYVCKQMTTIFGGNCSISSNHKKTKVCLIFPLPKNRNGFLTPNIVYEQESHVQ